MSRVVQVVFPALPNAAPKQQKTKEKKKWVNYKEPFNFCKARVVSLGTSVDPFIL